MLTFSIGDIHGCYGKLIDLLARCQAYAAGRPHRFVFIGDYIDRGPDSRQVVQHLIELDLSSASHVFLRGNHEEMLLHALLDPAAAAHWIANGGGATLASYGVHLAEEIPAAHIHWLTNRPLTHDDDLRLFVHAGINPARPIDHQSTRDLLWIREPFLSSEMKFSRLLVHGHSPTRDGKPEVHSNRINVDTGAAFGRSLTAAVFDTVQRPPLDFLQSDR